MMKIILTLLMFSHNFLYALELKELEVSLPLGLAHLDKSPLKAGETEVKYLAKVYQNLEQDLIPIKVSKLESIDGLMSSLVYAYVNQDQELFKSLFDKKSAKQIDFNSEKFKYSFDYLKKIKKPHIKYAFAYEKGYIVSWSAIGLLTDRILFVKKIKKEFKIFDLAIPKDDHFFWNMGLYFKFAPFKVYSPMKPKVTKTAGKYKINVKVHEFKNWLYIFSPKSKKNIIALSDNFPNNKEFKDYDLNSKAIELKVDAKRLKSLTPPIYMLEASYQLESFPKNIIKKAIKLELP